jgi:hypothetical protein
MGYFKDKTIKLEEDMTRYIENCTEEIMTELKLNDSAKEVITMVLQRNLDKLFKLLLEEQEDDNKHIHTEKKET